MSQPKPHRSPQGLADIRRKTDKNFRRIQFVERKMPAFKRLSRHPKFGVWLPTIFAIGEVAVGLLLALLIPFLLNLLPDFHINGPRIDIPFPSINLPDWPSINWPTPPAWLGEILKWLKRTWPIWIALAFGIYEVRKRNRSKTPKS